MTAIAPVMFVFRTEQNVSADETEIPLRLIPEDAIRILEEAGETIDLSKRMNQISSGFLGRAYQECSLGGGPGLTEEFRIDLKVFDCVTFIEVVMALALSGNVDEFIKSIRRIRYQDGQIAWITRNHYMIDWAANNERSGFITNITHGPLTVEKTCTLNLIQGLPEKTATFRYFPIPELERSSSFEDGDIVLFVSTRQTLDVFHTGLVFPHNDRVLMRHATRRAGMVVEQDLQEFIDQNQMAGVILLRPQCPR